MRQRDQHVVISAHQRPVRLARGFEHGLAAWIGRRHAEDDRIRCASRGDQARMITGPYFTQSHDPQVEGLPDLFLERRSQIVGRGVLCERTAERFEHLAQARNVVAGLNTWGSNASLYHRVRLIHDDLRERPTKRDAMAAFEQ